MRYHFGWWRPVRRWAGQAGEVIGEPTDTSYGPAEAAEAAEVARWINDAIRALPAGQRQTAGPYYLADLTQAEAAAHLGIPAGVIKTRLHKARGAPACSITARKGPCP